MVNKEMVNTAKGFASNAAAVVANPVGRYEKEANDIKEDISALKSDIKTFASKAADEGSEVIAEAKERAGDQLVRLRDLGADSMKRAEEYVREKPAQSLAIALLAGFLLNAFCRK